MPVGVRKFRNERLLFPVLFKPSQKHSKKRSVLTKLEFDCERRTGRSTFILGHHDHFLSGGCTTNVEQGVLRHFVANGTFSSSLKEGTTNVERGVLRSSLGAMNVEQGVLCLFWAALNVEWGVPCSVWGITNVDVWEP